MLDDADLPHGGEDLLELPALQDLGLGLPQRHQIGQIHRHGLRLEGSVYPNAHFSSPRP